MTSLSSLDENSSVRQSHSTSPLLDLSASKSSPKVTEHSSHRLQSRWAKLQSWRVGIMLCASSAGFAFFVNLALIIWTSTKGFEGGIATIQEGDCNTTKRLDLWLHLGINLLSTLLLGASNYTMQCLSAPTRDEINTAHQQRMSLDIGIASVWNLRRISPRRVILWWLLALSSIPLHLMYNSVVFSTLSTHPYTAAIVSHDFLKGAPFDKPSPISSHAFLTGAPVSNRTYLQYGFHGQDDFVEVDVQRLTALRNDRSTLQNLSNEDCLKAYRNELVLDRLDVLAVSSTTKTSSSLLSYWPENVLKASRNRPTDDRYPYGWTCTQSASERCPHPAQNNWTVFDSPIEYCLSERTEPSCKLQLSLVIMVIVILCNFAKSLCMGLTLWKPSSMPLLTLGDAITSFLDLPDPNTANNCLASKYGFNSDTLPSWMSAVYGQDSINAANGWDLAISTAKPRRYYWFQATSRRSWFLCIPLYTFTLVIAGILLRNGLAAGALGDTSMSYLWSLGYGGVNSETTIHLDNFLSGKLLPLILLANLPQALFSFLYLIYNALFTSMLLAEEWSGFAHERKTLRVTSPVGKQRSTFWLQLPYSFGIPLLVMSGILHWLVSQSIFLVSIAVQDNHSSFYGSHVGEETILTCGYSPIAIITVISLGMLLLLVLIANGFGRRYKEGMPLAGNCSAAISAACHRPEEDVDAAVLPVLWGAVSTEGPIGHCCFTSFEVSSLVKGKSYAYRDAMSSMESVTATRA